MDNTSMRTADRLTHVKILGVSLVAAALVVCIGVAASPTGPHLEARAPVVKAGQPVIWSGAGTTTIR